VRRNWMGDRLLAHGVIHVNKSHPNIFTKAICTTIPLVDILTIFPILSHTYITPKTRSPITIVARAVNNSVG
jgi:hypothetical protein